MVARGLTALLVLALLVLQIGLWSGPGSYAEVAALAERVEARQQENRALERRNAKLARQVRALKSGPEGVEARARHELGMIHSGETFYMLVPNDEAGDATH